MGELSRHHAFPSFLTGLFLICACVLMLQIMETRLLSVMSWYYLAFSRSAWRCSA